MFPRVVHDPGALLDIIVPRTLEGIGREYPNGVVIGVSGPGEWREPRERHPIFYGSYDWHSSVHSHWQLARILRCYPDHELAPVIETTLDGQFTAEGVAGEMDTLARWPGWQFPYGMAWLLQLGAELAEWDNPLARYWAEALEPMFDHAAAGFERYLSARSLPVRTGTHNQTAFSLGLVHDWATTTGSDLVDRIADVAVRYYAGDTAAPLGYEPSAVDFLSPSLAEADLMRRVFDSDTFGRWLDSFFPERTESLVEMLPPQPVVDPTNGQLAHIAGLNMSRAWMAEGIASSLDHDHRLHVELVELADRHRSEGFEAALHPDYMVTHWAPTFVVYLMTRRGLTR